MSFLKYFNLNYNKGPAFGDEMANPEEALKYWNFEGAIGTVKKLTHAFGQPRGMSIYDAEWGHVAGFSKVWVVDESIPHDFPTPHQDWLYSERQIAVPPSLYKDLANVSGSIIIDAQRGAVIVRCQSLVKNAVTLGFVEDVVSGKAKPTPEEYAKRIEGNIVPEWFQDTLSELSEAKKEHVFVSWSKDDGVLRWSGKKRSGSDIWKKKPTKGEVEKHLKKVFGTDVDVELRESINEAKKFAGWIAIHGGKKLEIKKSEAKDLYAAKQLAIKKLNVPKSKQGLLAIDVAYED